MTTTAQADPATAAGLLASARAERRAADEAEARLLRVAVEWAALHAVDHLDDAEAYGGTDLFGNRGIPIAGPGAPLVEEFAAAELAAAIGMSSESGKRLVGQAVELAHRLPRLWERVADGSLPAWRARRVAEATISRGLVPSAAAFVDHHVAPAASRVSAGQVDRLVTEAVGRFMPEAAEAERRAGADGRHFTIDHAQVSFHGTSQVTGELDLADALDLEDAVRQRAAALADLGCDEPLEVRRALAIGEIARRQLALDLETSPAPGPRRQRPVRRTVLHVHLSASALQGGDHVGRCENTRSPITTEQIRQWCGHPDTHLSVKPVIDLADHVHVDAYEVPDRIRERLALRDHTCVFPWCTRPARTLRPDRHGCDCDHVAPYDAGGSRDQTCTCRLAPLCRTHHRLKTHGGWRCTVLEPGSYRWTSPRGAPFLRDHTGTRDLTLVSGSPPRR